jgi:hypothetical protein
VLDAVTGGKVTMAEMKIKKEVPYRTSTHLHTGTYAHPQSPVQMYLCCGADLTCFDSGSLVGSDYSYAVPVNKNFIEKLDTVHFYLAHFLIICTEVIN